MLGKDKVFLNNSFFHNIPWWLFTTLKLSKKYKINLFLAFHNNAIVNGLLFLLVKWLSPKTIKVFFPYDILQYARVSELKYKLRSRFFFFFDRICYENVDKIITKGSEEELRYLKGFYKIHHKPHFAFNFLIEKKDTVDKKDTSLDFGDVQLVFIGGVFSDKYNDNNYNVFKELLQEKHITLHIYSHSSLDILNDLKHHTNLVIHPYITEHKELIEEISKYDFGISISDPFEHEFIQAKMASGMRIYDYIASGLPIIIDEKHELEADIVKINNFGIVIPRHDVKNIIGYIKRHDYKQLIESIKKNREKYFVEKNAGKIIEFLEK